MTTIILTIIGILLAAVAALMVIFYGGDAFNAGSVGARANTLQNAGTNVLSAVQLYKGTEAKNPADIAALIPLYLKEQPALGGVTTGAATYVIDSDLVAAGETPQYTVAGVSTEVCDRVNTNLGRTVTTDKAGKMGCDTTDKVFFANI